MAKANIKADFKSDIAKVWDTVTDLENYGWRSDIGKIEVLEQGRKFVEYTKKQLSYYLYCHKIRTHETV